MKIEMRITAFVFLLTAFAHSACLFASGSGTKGSPYQISTPEQLQNLNECLGSENQNNYYILTQNIDLTDYLAEDGDGYNNGAGWKPIGNNSNHFYGNFNGNGYKITGLWINRPNTDYVGLFGYLGYYGVEVTENVGIEIDNVKGGVKGKYNVGGLVGWNNGIITNSYVNGNVNGDEAVGGLVGFNRITIVNSYATGNVSGTDAVGGLVGEDQRGGGSGISNSYAVSNVSGASNVGGLIGNCDTYYGCVSNSYYDKTTSGQSDTSKGEGKTTAEMKSQALIDNLNDFAYYQNQEQNELTLLKWVYEEGEYPKLSNELPNEYSSINGIGEFFESEDENSYKINTKEQLRGFSFLVSFGKNFEGQYIFLENDIFLNDTANWQNWNSTTVGLNQWFAIGVNSTNSFKGTFEGAGHVISGMYINTTADYQGLFGYVSGSISNLGVIAFYVKGNNNVSGLIGRNEGTISNSYAAGSVSGNGYVGGLTGENQGIISNSYAVSSVNGTSSVGGLAGNKGGTISNSYASGSVSGTSNVGGLTGENQGNSTVSNSYYDKTTSGQTDTGKGEGKTTTEMKTQNTYTDWDFYGVWEINVNKNNGYPTLAVFNSSHFASSVIKPIPSQIWTGRSICPDPDVMLGGNILTIGTDYSVTCKDNKSIGVAEIIITSLMPASEGQKKYVNFSIIPANCGVGFTNGNGSAANPYLISNAKELDAMHNCLDYSSGEYFSLTNDIDLTDYLAESNSGWQPIGNGLTLFRGNLNGNGHKITGLWINRPNTDNIGLFGDVTSSSSIIENVGIEIDNAKGGVKGKENVGGLVGWNFGAIENIYVIGNVNGSDKVGGLVGYNLSDAVSNSHATGSVSGSIYVGGLIGWSNGIGTVTNSYAIGNVIGGRYVGGLVGYNSGNTIINSYASGNVNGGSSVGGLVGENSGTVSGSYYDKTTSGQSDAGKGEGRTTAEMQTKSTYADWDFDGIWEINENNGYPTLAVFNPLHFANAILTPILPQTWTGEAICPDFNIMIGGNTLILGSDYSVTCKNNKSIGTAEMTITSLMPATERQKKFVKFSIIPANCGVGFASGNGSAANPYLISNAKELDAMHNCENNSYEYFSLANDIDLTDYLAVSDSGWNPIGGGNNRFSGNFNGNSYKITGLWINRPNGYYIGLFGTTYGETIIENVGIEINNAKGGIKGFSFVGGLVGYNGVTISNSYVIGSVSGSGSVGGLVGWNYSGSIVSGSYATGNVSGSGNVGGLVGRNNSTIYNSYASGDVSGSGSVGGLVGQNVSDGNVSGSYAAGSVSGSSNVGGLVGEDYRGSVSESYYDRETSGQSDDDGMGFPKSTAEMKLQATYAGWDFVNVWSIKEGTSYPTHKRTIEYKNLGGANNPNPAIYSTEDTPITLTTLSRPGYDFLGWLNEQYSPAVPITEIPENSFRNFVLSARWQPKIYSITYSGLGEGASNSNPSQYSSGDSVILLAPNGLAGQTFNGWLENGRIASGITASDTGDRFFEAQWLVKSNIITFDKNSVEAVLSVDSQFATYGEPVGILPVPTLSGHKFLGWFSDDGSLYTEKTLYTSREDVELTAVWESLIHKTVLEIDGAYSYIDVIDGLLFGALPVPSKPGFEFAGWFDRLGNEITFLSVYLSESGMDTLTARFTETESSETINAINFDANGGSLETGEETKQVAQGYAIGIMPTPVKESGTFFGWFSSLDETGVQITSDYEIAGDLTLYARWNSGGKKVKLNPKGGEINAESERYVVIGDTLGLLPVPERSGYAFDGWKDAGGAEYMFKSAMPNVDSLELFANYIPAYKITFDPMNGVLGKDEYERTGVYGVKIGVLPRPYRSGFEFAGWFTSLDESGSQITADSVYSRGYPISLFAKWDKSAPGVYNLIFEYGNCQKDVSSKTVTLGSQLGSLPYPECGDSAFAGWYAEPNSAFDPNGAALQFVEETIYNNRGDLTVYANYKEKEKAIIVTLNGNGGLIDGQIQSLISATGGLSIGYLPGALHENMNYEFLGWFTETEGGAEYSYASVAPNNNIALYAHWRNTAVEGYKISLLASEDEAPLLTLTFNSCGGAFNSLSDAPETRTKFIYGGINIGDLGTDPERGDYAFRGWFTSCNGGNEVTERTKFSENATIYAHYKPISFPVSLNARGGYLSGESDVNFYKGIDVGYLPPAELEDYIFDGWYDKAEGGNRYSYYTIYKNSSVDSLHAHYTQKPFEIKLNARGGDGVPDRISATHGKPIGKLPMPSKNGYSFAGWVDELESIYKSESIAERDSLIALWMPASAQIYKVHLNSQGGSFYGQDKDTALTAKGFAIGILPIPLKSGFEFAGWHDSANGGNKYSSSTIYKNSAVKTLYAQWQESPYAITLNASGGSVNSSTVKVNRGSVIGSLPVPTPPQSASQAFAGWFSEANGGEERGANFIPSSDLTVYAHYLPKYEIALNATGGFLSEKIKYAIDGIAVGVLPVPEKNDSVFAGWFSTMQGGTRITEKSLFASNSTIYARWEAKSREAYLIQFKSQGGNAVPDLVVYKGEKIGEMPIPQKTGYSFGGWFTNVTGGSQYTSQTVYNLGGKTYLFAKWNNKNSIEKPILSQAEFEQDGTLKTVSLTCGISECPAHVSLSGQLSATEKGDYVVVAAIADTATYQWVGGTTAPISLKWSIIASTEIAIEVPASASGLAYNGEEQIGIPAGTGYSISGVYSATNAGNYTATVKLTGGYKWTDGTKTDKTIDWSIAKTAGSFGTPAALSATWSPTLTLASITPASGYTWDNPSTTITLAGEQSFPAAYAHPSGNYETVNGSIIVKVAKIQIAKPSLVISAFTYNGELKTVSLSATNTAYSLGGDVSATETGTYTATVSLGNPQNYEWTDGTTTPLNLSWSIISADGEFIPLESALEISFAEGLTLGDIELPENYSWATPNAPLNAGTGQEFQTIYSPQGYEPALGNVIVNIAKAVGTFVSTSAQNTTYNPALTLNDIELPSDYKWANPSTPLNASNNQTFPAEYTHMSGNYETASGNITVNVAKAAGVFVNSPALNVIYSPSLTLASVSLPNGYAWKTLSTTLLSGDNQTFPASYADPSGNYNPANGMLKVNVAKAAVPKPALAAASFEYSAGAQSVSLTPESNLYYIGGEASKTAAGNYTATASLVDIDNYEWEDGSIDHIVLEWTITKYAVSIPAVANDLIENGQMQKGVPAGVGYTLSGTYQAIAAGNYTAVLTLLGTNYQWSDGTNAPKEVLWSIADSSSTPIIAGAGNFANPMLQAQKTYYSMHGVSLGTYKPTTPGAYIVKQGKSVRKVIVK